MTRTPSFVAKENAVTIERSLNFTLLLYSYAMCIVMFSQLLLLTRLLLRYYDT